MAARVEDLAPEVGHVRARVRRALDHPLEVPALSVLEDGVRAPADHKERVARTKSEPSGCLEPTALRGDAELLPAVGIQGNHLADVLAGDIEVPVAPVGVVLEDL